MDPDFFFCTGKNHCKKTSGKKGKKKTAKLAPLLKMAPLNFSEN
jgi:hypothetical protein